MDDDRNAEFKLVSSFDIDGGELDGMSPQECFVLGYELCLIDLTIKSLVTGDTIERPVHAANQDRIRKRCENAGLAFRLEYMSDDSSESWMLLRAGPLL